MQPAAPQPPRARRALQALALAAGVTVCLVGAVNLLVDPYGYFGTPTIAGLSQRKPTAFQHDRFLKAGLVRRGHPDCLLAGSSRVGEGLDTQDPALAPCRDTLDVSLAGPNVQEMTAIAESALRRGGVRRVVMSLDFFAFNPSREVTRGGREIFSTGWNDRAAAAFAATLDSGTFTDSMRTLVRQRDQPFHEPNGNVNQAMLAQVETVRSTRATFARGVRGYILHVLPGPRHIFPPIDKGSEPLRQLQAFLVEQHRRGVEVVLFFSPTHAWHWELIDALGLWPTWEAWRHAVLAVNEEAARNSSRTPFPVWDFVTYGPPSAEPVAVDPAALAPLPSFWDNSHFKRTLGSRLLSRMLVASSPETLGTPVDAASLTVRHEQIRQEREQWRSGFPADHRDVVDVVRCFAPVKARERAGLRPGDPDTCNRLLRLTR